MAKINDLRSLVNSLLNTIKTSKGINGIYYQVAQDNAMYPHVLFSFDSMRTLSDDCNRRDITLVIDVYDRQNSAVRINDIADAIEDLFDQKNLPQARVLPTLYFDQRRDLPDEDKLIKHIQLEFTIQNYERN